MLSFGTAGCNLACKFCQNWDLTKSRDMDSMMDAATPEDIARAAREAGARSVAYTYNDPIIFAEYAIDVAEACRAAGIANVAVSNGFIHAEPRREFYGRMDAVNVDLKAFTDDFYVKLTGSKLAPVLESLAWLVHESKDVARDHHPPHPGPQRLGRRDRGRVPLDPQGAGDRRAAALQRLPPRLTR